MIKPKLDEIKKEFIKRGMKDEVVIDKYPDSVERLTYLSNTWNNEAAKDDFVKKLESIFKGIKGDKGELGDIGPIGNKGPVGDKGPIPIKGIDYFTRDEINHAREEIKHGMKPTVIEKTIIQKSEIPFETLNSLISEAISQVKFNLTAEDIVSELQSLKGDNRLDASAIKNLPKPKIEMIGGGGGSSSSTGGASAFVDLTDVPSSYSGQGGKTVTVKSDASGLEFTTPAGGGDMLVATYDPQNINDDAFDRANHTGTQLSSTISDLESLLYAYSFLI